MTPTELTYRQRILKVQLYIQENLDEDLSGFYALAAEDPDLAWVTAGAGRMLRPATVYETVVKTICTTNTDTPSTIQ